ncbi:MAG: cupin domain-containing protein [Actinomycetota bacterium]
MQQIPARQFHNPHTGERITLLATAEETGGELTRMEIQVKPGPADWVGPDHFHPLQEERFEVLAGIPSFRIQGEERTAAPGDVVTVPVGISHIFRNGGGGELRMISEYRPGLKSVETFCSTFFGLAADGKTNKRGRPHPLQSVLTLWEVRDYFVVTRPPPSVQRVLFPPLAALARMRGYRTSYPEYSSAGPTTAGPEYVERASRRGS